MKTTEPEQAKPELSLDKLLALSEREKAAIFRSCERFLNYHPRQALPEVFQDLAKACQEGERADSYGKGDLIESFESEVAKLLGLEAGVFLPSGTMAQPIALRIWSDWAQNKCFGLHPTSHLEIHEHHAYRHLHGLQGCLLGKKEQVLNTADLEACPESLASVILELPHRDLGGALPSWEEVEKMSAWCKKRKVRFHLDGARLWESGPYYGKSYREICALFDSVYVSFYKGLGGIAGAILAGPKVFVEEARVWQRRQGGNLVHLYPFVISARTGLERRLNRMRLYYEKAVEIGRALEKLPGVQLVPPQPQTNMMHLILAADPKHLEAAFLEIALRQKVALFPWAEGLPDGRSKVELTVGDCTLGFSAEEISELMRAALRGPLAETG